SYLWPVSQALLRSGGDTDGDRLDLAVAAIYGPGTDIGAAVPWSPARGRLLEVASAPARGRGCTWTRAWSTSVRPQRAAPDTEPAWRGRDHARRRGAQRMTCSSACRACQRLLPREHSILARTDVCQRMVRPCIPRLTPGTFLPR